MALRADLHRVSVYKLLSAKKRLRTDLQRLIKEKELEPIGFYRKNKNLSEMNLSARDKRIAEKKLTVACSGGALVCGGAVAWLSLPSPACDGVGRCGGSFRADALCVLRKKKRAREREL